MRSNEFRQFFSNIHRKQQFQIITIVIFWSLTENQSELKTMLSIAAKNKIEELLGKIEIQATCLNVTELEGLFYALVITPELIAPSEWIPIVFDNEIPECDSKDTLQQLISELIHVYNHYNTLYINGNIRFPYTLSKTLEPDLVDAMLDWNFGFLKGLELRMEFWNSGIFAEKMKLEKDPIAEIIKVITFISDPEYEDSDFFISILKNKPVELSDEAFLGLTMNEFLETLPDMVNMLQRFASVLKKTNGRVLNQPQVQSKKIGRNDPCFCGSGNKYKKCCGVSGVLEA